MTRIPPGYANVLGLDKKYNWLVVPSGDVLEASLTDLAPLGYHITSGSCVTKD